MAYQPATGCAVVLSERDNGSSWLRLFQAAKLEEVCITASKSNAEGIRVMVAYMLNDAPV